MKTAVKFLLSVFFMITFSSPAFAVPTPEQMEIMVGQIRQEANNELRPAFGNDDYFPQQISTGYKINGSTYYYLMSLTYGPRHGKKPSDYDPETDTYRYIGYTALEEDHTDVFFRPDFTGQIQIDTAEWIEKPQLNSEVQKFVTETMGEKTELKKNPLNYNPSYRNLIIAGFEGLSGYNRDYYKFDPANPDIAGKDWENYVHVLAPPTKYSMGTGRMFRWVNGNIRYLDVPLVSKNDLVMDFSTNLAEEGFQSDPGAVIETTAAFQLNKECYHPERGIPKIYLSLDGSETELPFTFADPALQLDKDGSIEFKPGDRFIVKFSFTLPDKPGSEIVSRITPKPYRMPRKDKDPTNNEDRAPLLGQYDISVKLFPHLDDFTFTTVNGEETFISYGVRVTRKDSIPGEINIVLYSNGEEIHTTLGQGEKEIAFSFDAGPGAYPIYAEAWPVGRNDSYPLDNRDDKTITVADENFEDSKGIRVELLDN